jgi:hypothetical protein
MPRALPLPSRIGPAEFSELGGMVAVRCPQEFADILRRAGSVWGQAPIVGCSSAGASVR